MSRQLGCTTSWPRSAFTVALRLVHFIYCRKFCIQTCNSLKKLNFISSKWGNILNCLYQYLLKYLDVKFLLLGISMLNWERGPLECWNGFSKNMSKYGVGWRNENGERLHNFFISNIRCLQQTLDFSIDRAEISHITTSTGTIRNSVSRNITALHGNITPRLTTCYVNRGELRNSWHIGRLGMTDIRRIYSWPTADIRLTSGGQAAVPRLTDGWHTADILLTYAGYTAESLS